MSDSGRRPARVAYLLSAALAVVVGCAGEHAPSSAGPLAATSPVATASAADAPTAAQVRVMADGSLELTPAAGEVAMLERQPDGSFRRKCGPATADVQNMMNRRMDTLAHAARGSK